MTEEKIDTVIGLCHEQMKIYPGKEYNYKILKRGMEEKGLRIIEIKLEVFSNKYKEVISMLERIEKSRRKERLESIVEKQNIRKEFFYDLEILAIEITFFNKEVISYYGFYDYREG